MQESTNNLITHLKALADPVRLRLLALCVRGEATVSELTEVMSQSQPRVSQHLNSCVAPTCWRNSAMGTSSTTVYR